MAGQRVTHSTPATFCKKIVPAWGGISLWFGCHPLILQANLELFIPGRRLATEHLDGGYCVLCLTFIQVSWGCKVAVLGSLKVESVYRLSSSHSWSTSHSSAHDWGWLPLSLAALRPSGLIEENWPWTPFALFPWSCLELGEAVWGDWGPCATPWKGIVRKNQGNIISAGWWPLCFTAVVPE